MSDEKPDELSDADVADLLMMGFDSMNPDVDPATTDGAVQTPTALIHFARCEGCQVGGHFDPPEWHSWAGPDDLEFARSSGQDVDRIKGQRCACHCAVTA